MGGNVFMKEITEVSGGKVVESFIGKEKIFVLNAILYGEPMKSDENRSDVVC